MLTLIHGTDIAASRKFFTGLKEKYKDTPILDGINVTLTDLAQILEGGGLFTEDKAVFIENFFTRKKSSSEYKSILSYFKKISTSADIVIWEGKELENSILTQLKGSTIRVFKLPQSLFTFLDSIRPNNGKQLVQLFHNALVNSDVDALFYMLIRQFRLLLALHPNSVILSPTESGEGSYKQTSSAKPQNDFQIEECKRMQDWQKTKLQRQSKSFPSKKLIKIYSNLFAMEKAYKTGGLPSSLSNSIDILLLGI